LVRGEKTKEGKGKKEGRGRVGKIENG